MIALFILLLYRKEFKNKCHQSYMIFFSVSDVELDQFELLRIASVER